MEFQKSKAGFAALLAGLAVFLLLALAVQTELEKEKESKKGYGNNSFWGEVAENMCGKYMPLLLYEKKERNGENWFLQKQFASALPLYVYVKNEVFEEGKTEGKKDDKRMEKQTESSDPFRKIYDISEVSEDLESLIMGENRDYMGKNGISMEKEDQGPKETIPEMDQDGQILPFSPNSRQVVLDTETLQNFDLLVGTYYTVDKTTTVNSKLLSAEKLLKKDMRVSKEEEGPQILIYHTHSQEGFVDSEPGETDTTIMGVGEYLKKVLEEQYGYQVLHHLGQYDVENRDDAYGKALPEIEEVLRENPSIQVVIDLHRDEMDEQTRLVMDLNGRPTARFMFFNGLSRTKKTGEIAYLKNEYLEDNLAFSLQMQLAAAQYYPGLTRKIYLKSYRYNMHLRPKTLLIELGAQNNSLLEVQNACDPLAHLLDLVLSGKAAEELFTVP